jgi:hypothetical protein
MDLLASRDAAILLLLCLGYAVVLVALRLTRR